MKILTFVKNNSRYGIDLDDILHFFNIKDVQSGFVEFGGNHFFVHDVFKIENCRIVALLKNNKAYYLPNLEQMLVEKSTNYLNDFKIVVHKDELIILYKLSFFEGDFRG